MDRKLSAHELQAKTLLGVRVTPKTGPLLQSNTNLTVLYAWTRGYRKYGGLTYSMVRTVLYLQEHLQMHEN